jgi:hypothetical protein
MTVFHDILEFLARFQILTAGIMKMLNRVFCRNWGLALMMEAVSTYETSINFYETTRHITEDYHLYGNVFAS